MSILLPPQIRPPAPAAASRRLERIPLIRHLAHYDHRVPGSLPVDKLSAPRH